MDIPEKSLLIKALELMLLAKSMTDQYEANFKFVSKYVHATSRGHEAIQIAMGLQLTPDDYLFPYYRDDAMMLAIGMKPYDMMLQLMARKDDPFSGGRSYYCHPSLKDVDKPKIPHQSSATGMQAIPAAGAALGLKYKESIGSLDESQSPIVVCSLGDASVTEGEVSEAFQMAALKSLPIIFLVQDNGWDISAKRSETMTWNAAEYVQGIAGLESVSIDGADFLSSFRTVETVLNYVRKVRKPFVLHATVPLLNHHTSGVRMEWYRDDLDEHKKRDPLPRFIQALIDTKVLDQGIIADMVHDTQLQVQKDYEKAKSAPFPDPEDLFSHALAPTTVLGESGQRVPEHADEKNMVDCGIFAIRELMTKHPECLLYGQDVGQRLGGVFREAATLADQFGDHRVFNTPIQEAFIVGSTVGMSAVGLKPIVEVQFADYIWPGLNQLFTEASRSYYLSNGKYPVSMVLRVPCGAYGSGGPYHSSSIESIVTNIRGIKVVYPSTAADLKGLLKAAYYDPNPVIILEHKGLYWSKIPGTETAITPEPSADYIIPIGKARLVWTSNAQNDQKGESISIITYGRGIYWALEACKDLEGKVEILDLRSLSPLDETMIFDTVKKTGKCLVITEESHKCSFANGLMGIIQQNCFEFLDAPVMLIGAEDLPAIPLNETLEQTMLPSASKVRSKVNELIAY